MRQITMRQLAMQDWPALAERAATDPYFGQLFDTFVGMQRSNPKTKDYDIVDMPEQEVSPETIKNHAARARAIGKKLNPTGQKLYDGLYPAKDREGNR